MVKRRPSRVLPCVPHVVPGCTHSCDPVLPTPLEGSTTQEAARTIEENPVLPELEIADAMSRPLSACRPPRVHEINLALTQEHGFLRALRPDAEASDT